MIEVYMETADRRRSDDRKRMILRAISVAWPAMAESFFVTLAGMIDTMMVSALGSYAVAAVGLTNQPKFIALTLFFGINIAVSALVARRKGEQRRESANEILLTALWMKRLSAKQFGGMSGDLSGYFLQLAELIMLLCCVVISKVVVL